MKLKFLLFGMLGLGIAHNASAAEQVGMACHLTGKPEAKIGGAWKPLRVLQKLSRGDAIRCGANESAVVVIFQGGKRYEIGAGATANINADTVSNAKFLGGARGSSARVATSLGGARTGAILFRPAPSYQPLRWKDLAKSDKVDPKAPPSHDWLRADNPTWAMNTIPTATSYVFTLVDPKDYVVWSANLASDANAARLEITLPPTVKLASQRPYVWRLQGFTEAGKTTKSWWGIATALSPEDEARLLADEKALLDDGTLPTDATQLALLVETYRNYGVLVSALDLLGKDALNTQPGVAEATDEIYAQAGPYALMLAKQKRDE